MKTLSPLAAQILPLLAAPQRADHVWRDLPNGDNYALRDVESALDELVPDLATCDEHDGVPYFYRRDRAAEQTRMSDFADAARIATCARDVALALAHADFAAACEAADAVRDAADPMAAIRGGK